jgi:hypothetical protein
MRTHRWRQRAGVALVLAATAGTAGGAHEQAPSAGGPTAILAGRAVDAVTGEPVANTLIGLSQRAGPGPNTTPTAPNTSLVTVMADSRGRFVIRDVPKGSFLLLATAPGYIVSNYGQARPGGPTRTLDLTGNERLVDLKIPLWRHGVISGEVVDEAGDPVVGVIVRVLRRAPNGAGGQARYMPGTQTTTDDRGRYRLTALSPGQFLVTVPQTQVTVPASVVDVYLQAGATRAGAAAGGQLLDLMSSASAVPSAGGGVRVDEWLLQSSAGGGLMTLPPASSGLLVYPTAISTTGPRERDIVVGAGEERSAVNFSLRPERARRVTGIVTAAGAPAGKVSVRLIRNDGATSLNQNGYEAAATVTADDGTFTLLGVTSGEYTLKVLRTPRLTLPSALRRTPPSRRRTRRRVQYLRRLQRQPPHQSSAPRCRCRLATLTASGSSLNCGRAQRCLDKSCSPAQRRRPSRCRSSVRCSDRRTARSRAQGCRSRASKRRGRSPRKRRRRAATR